MMHDSANSRISQDHGDRDTTPIIADSFSSSSSASSSTVRQSPEPQADALRKVKRSPEQSFEMDDSGVLQGIGDGHIERRTLLSRTSRPGSTTGSALRNGFFGGAARHTVGLILLLCVVFLWTLSNFLGSSIFADASYAKPFFLTYLNTSIFVFAMIPTLTTWTLGRYRDGTLRSELRRNFSKESFILFFKGTGSQSSPRGLPNIDESEAFLKPHQGPPITSSHSTSGSISSSQQVQNHVIEPSIYLGLVPTARLALIFCFLWFGANYFAMGCLQYTTVASATILTSTSSVWTLLIGAVTRTEKFTWRKLCGVLSSLAGIMLISEVDFSAPSSSDERKQQRLLRMFRRAIDDFPDKSATELALGDGLALLSAVIYGFYTITLKQSTLKASPLEIHMPTFFGIVGLFNIILLLPLFPILHYTGIEPFIFPPSLRIWSVLIGNSISSFLSDIMWAYAMVFTSPLVVTVGLSLTIPLSLVGEMVVQARYEGWIYWVGAMIVVGSFVFVQREEVKEDAEDTDNDTENQANLAERGDVFVTERNSQNVRRSLSERDDDLAELLEDDEEDDGEEDHVRDRLQRQADGIDVHGR